MSAAHALGVGPVNTDSFVGQRFSATIPVFSISNTGSLVAELTNVPRDRSGKPLLQSQIDNRNGEVVIHVTSEQPVSELYLSFGLQLSDQQQVLNKEFTVLLDVATPSLADVQGNGSSTPLYSNSVQSVSNSRPDLMGPYDWAQRGNIPRRFGAVIEGQSLWRVARRINTAMGVSINQMMWGLFTLNPDSFSSGSIDSLRAGTYLDIPSYAQVTEFTDVQSKQKINSVMSIPSNSSIANQTENTDVTPTTIDGVTEDFSNTELASSAQDSDEFVAQDEDDSFQLTGISEVPGSSLGVPAATEEVQEVINSLSITVGNLTQELFLKDKKIDYLEERISALEGVLVLDSLVDGTASIGSPVNAQSSVSEGTAVTSVIAENNQSTPPVKTEKIEKSFVQKIRPWVLWGCALLSMILVFMICWPRLVSLAAGLRLFGADEKIEFNSELTVEETPVNRFAEPNDTDFSTMEILKNTLDKDAVEGISYMEFDDEHEDLRPEAIVLSESDVGTDFQKRFTDLIHRQLFGDARELLELNFIDKAIDETVYHYERLRLYFEQRDEEGFYTYYYEVEAEMPHFDEEVNRKISEMVILLGQVG